MPSNPDVYLEALRLCAFAGNKLSRLNAQRLRTFLPQRRKGTQEVAQGLSLLNIPAAGAGFFVRLVLCLGIVFHFLDYSTSRVVHAQSTTATLSGTVADQAGASIPGVQVTVLSIVQGFQRSAVTNDEGIFVIPVLPPGTYTVRAERQGFSTGEVSGVVLNVNDQKAIRILLKVGQVSQTVEIVDGSNLIDQSATVETVVDRQFVGNLPLNGRSFQSLITLTPGTVLTPTSGVEFGQFSVNGQRADANYSMIDGVSANVSPTYATGAAFGQNNSGSVLGFSALGTSSNLVSIDALQEFKVMTSTFAPEFGRTPGGQVSIVTRSGGNDLHGSLFEYFRNDVLDANDWFANSRGLKRAALRQNIFGGTLSGPMLLPRFGEGGKQPWYNGRDRTFFFFSYEGQRLRLPKFAAVDVPSREARAAAPAAIKPIFDAFPLPTGVTRPNRFAEFAAAYSDPSSLDSTSIRLDHIINNKLILFGRYNYSPSEGVVRGNNSSLNVLNTIANKTQTLTIGVTSPLSATVNNEFRFNWSKVDGSQSFAIDNFGGAVAPPSSLFLMPQFATSLSSGTIVLAFVNSAQIRMGTLADNQQRQINITDNLSVTAGQHQFKFGVDYRRLLPFVGPTDYGVQVSFAGVNGALTGRASNASINTLLSGLEPVYTNFSAYAQDTWRIQPRFVLTYGVRWDVNPAPHEINGQHPAVLSGLENPSTMTLAPFGTSLYETTYTNFAPRAGIAYQLSQKTGRETILRAGFGFFYDLGNQTAGGAFGNAFPFLAFKFVPAPFFPLTPTQAAPPIPSRTLPVNSTVFGYDPNLELPRTYQWNLALEQSLGSQQSITVTYVGAAGRKLLKQQLTGGTALNNPNFNGVVAITRNTATSDYHSLQIQFQRRLSRGLQLHAFHTWSHSLDTASRDSATADSFPIAGLDPRIDRGSSDFDIRHVFRMAATYEPPAPNTGRIGKALLGNWAIDAIYTSQSRPPVDVFYFFSGAFDALTINGRPDLIAGVPLYIEESTAPGGRRINPAAFSIPTTTRQGSLGRNSLRGFPISQLDLVLRRQFSLSDRLKLQFRTEFFNVMNHPNFANPSALLGTNDFGTFFPNTNFGRSQNMLARGLSASATSGLSSIYQTGGPRSMQFSLRLEY